MAIEEQFYLLWPLVVTGVIAFAKRRTPSAVLVVAALGAIASSALMAWLYEPSNISRVYYGTDTRAASILVGAALAAALTGWGHVRGLAGRVSLEAIGLIATAFLAWAWVNVTGQSGFLYHGGFLLCGLAAAAVIAAATHPRSGVIARALSARPLCALGLVSYGVYLWHWPVYVVLDETRSGLRGYPLLAARVAVTITIAAVSYFALELPIRRGALSMRQSRFAIPAVAATLIVAIVASTAGARTRVSVAEAAPESVHTALQRARTAPLQARRVMVVGNSVGWFLGRALEQPGTATGAVVFNAARPACVFPSGITSYRFMLGGAPLTEPTTPCDREWKTDLDQFRPNIVLWVVSPGTDDALYNGSWTRLCDPGYDADYRRDLTHAVGDLSATGAKVVLTTAAYIRFGFPDSQRDQRVDCDNAIRRDVARATGSQVVDLFSYTCPGGTCRAQVDGVVLRPDGLHYEGPSARIVSRWILSQVTAPGTRRARHCLTRTRTRRFGRGGFERRAVLTSARALVLEAPRRLVSYDLPLPEIGDDDGLLRVEACGLCGTDHEEFTGEIVPGFAFVPGHESVGVIERLGAGAAARWGVAVGDRVAVEVFLSCRECDACRTGATQRCARHGLADMYGFVDVNRRPGLWGGYAEHQYLAPDSVLCAVPAELDPVTATLFNPLGAGIRWGVTVPETRTGDVVAVLGPGVRGLSACAAAKDAGASFVMVTGRGAHDAPRLAVAPRFGADLAVDVLVDDPIGALRSHTGSLADVVIDVTAKSPDAFTQAVKLARPGGTVVVAGTRGGGNAPGHPFNSDLIVYKELRVIGALGVDSSAYAAALALLAARRFPFEELPRRVVGLGRAGDLLREMAGEGEIPPVHTVVAPEAED